MTEENPSNPPLPPLPPRDPHGHKGTFGTVAVIGGYAGPDARMIGAPALAATSTLRAGAGLVRLVMPDRILDHGLVIQPSATGVPLPTNRHGDIVPHEAATALDELIESCDCIAIGPGLGRGDGPTSITLRAIQQDRVPVVVDADAINALAQTPQFVRDLRAAAVITPHPGEFKRLTRGMGLPNCLDIDSSRTQAASALAQRLGLVVVLKGAETVVTDGSRSWTNDTVNDALATAGSGDVLTGLIAGLIAQFVRLPEHPALAAHLPPDPAHKLDLFDAARLAVHVHGRCADEWTARNAADAGLLVRELGDLIPPVLKTLRAGG